MLFATSKVFVTIVGCCRTLQAGFVKQKDILFLPERLAAVKSQKIPNHTNTRSHQTAAIIQKFWKTPNKEDTWPKDDTSKLSAVICHPDKHTDQSKEKFEYCSANYCRGAPDQVAGSYDCHDNRELLTVKQNLAIDALNIIFHSNFQRKEK